MITVQRKKTVSVDVGGVTIGGSAPVIVQSMTNTDTADVGSTVDQVRLLADAGSELVRVTVNNDASARAVPEITSRLRDAGYATPIVGDFHYNGHLLLSRYPSCAQALAKFRINPGNVGTGNRRDEQFATICKIARDEGKPVRMTPKQFNLHVKLNYKPGDKLPVTLLRNGKRVEFKWPLK